MNPNEFLLRYFTDLGKLDIPLNIKDNSFGGRLSRLGQRFGTPLKRLLNQKASIPNLLSTASETIPDPWGRTLTSRPIINTLGGEVVDVAASTPRSFLSKVRGLPSGISNRFAGNPVVRNILLGTKSPIVGQVASNPVVKGTLGVGSKLLSLPAQLAIAELSEYNPYGDPSNPELYGKGPGSLEHAMTHGGYSPLYKYQIRNEEEFPNDYRTPSRHLETGEGPKHLETGEGPKHLSEEVDKFLEDKEVGKGKTRWVGKNSTWVDRNGIVIAPRVNEKGEVVGPDLGENISDY